MLGNPGVCPGNPGWRELRNGEPWERREVEGNNGLPGVGGHLKSGRPGMSGRPGIGMSNASAEAVDDVEQAGQ